mmetsp:Transcript_11330/g.23856  ORF Transcript_11330/g.23856 Transcript_11330/m.23856 type:complete len:204 (-) Transcript_11330:64-675(-)
MNGGCCIWLEGMDMEIGVVRTWRSMLTTMSVGKTMILGAVGTCFRITMPIRTRRRRRSYWIWDCRLEQETLPTRSRAVIGSDALEGRKNLVFLHHRLRHNVPRNWGCLEAVAGHFQSRQRRKIIHVSRLSSVSVPPRSDRPQRVVCRIPARESRPSFLLAHQRRCRRLSIMRKETQTRYDRNCMKEIRQYLLPILRLKPPCKY